MNKQDVTLVGNYIRKLYRPTLFVVGIITAIELLLMIRGFVLFDLGRLKHRLYLYSYIFLFAVSAMAAAVLLIFRRREEHTRLLVWQSYSYSACLMAWATFVTCIDCFANGDSGVMVYIMVCTSLGGLTLIHPKLFAGLVLASAATLVSVVWVLRGEPYSPGFYINFAVFVVMSMLINIHNYRLNRKEYESSMRLEQLSYTDQLTGMYNRRHLDMQIVRCAESGDEHLFLLMDVDDFKTINDTYGHVTGDECLVLLADQLRSVFGEWVYRFGGDELAVICALSEEDVCRRIADINRHLTWPGMDFELHISAGVCRIQAGDTANAVFTKADSALYRAKAEGKNACRVYDGK